MTDNVGKKAMNRRSERGRIVSVVTGDDASRTGVGLFLFCFPCPALPEN